MLQIAVEPTTSSCCLVAVDKKGKDEYDMFQDFVRKDVLEPILNYACEVPLLGDFIGHLANSDSCPLNG
jgi:hypothetical protein